MTATLPLHAVPDVWDAPDEAATVQAVADLLDQTVGSLHREWASLSTDARRRPGQLHPDAILELLQSMIDAGGKRFRPRMCHWGWVAAGGLDTRRGHLDMVRAATALELLHVFALIHDDVMDASPTRRGRASTHAAAARLHRHHRGVDDADKFGENIAILVGDLAHSEAGVLMATLPRRLQRVWRTLSVELMLGQGRDLLGAATGRRDLAAAREVARIKSGAYTVARPLQLGAVAAGASALCLDALADYGDHLGVAFALRDDLLGVFGDPAETGKPVGDDLVAGKPTMLLALAAERFTGADADLLALAGTPAMDEAAVAALSAALIERGVVAEVEDLIAASVESARNALTRGVTPEAAEGLAAIADRIAWRNS